MGIEVALAGIATFVTTLGSAVSFGAFAIGSIGAGVIGGAIVGAAIGGLTSAITGGDIGKGILYGAVGGAVTGGLGAWAQGGSLMQGPMTAPGTAMANVSQAAVDYELGVGTADAVTKSSGSLLSGGGGGMGNVSQGTGMLGQGAMDIGGKMIEGSAMEDMGKENRAAAAVAAEKAAENASKMTDKQGDIQKALAGMNNASREKTALLSANVQREGIRTKYKTDSEALAFQRSVYDTNNLIKKKELDTQRGALEGVRAKRAGSGPVGPAAPTAHEQIQAKEGKIYAA